MLKLTRRNRYTHSDLYVHTRMRSSFHLSFSCWIAFFSLLFIYLHMTTSLTYALPSHSFSIAEVSQGHPYTQPPFIAGESACLIDVKSGRILYEKASEKPMRIASLTKIMTAIVAIEQGQLAERVVVSEQAYGKEGSSLYLKLGETMSLHHLLYGLMLRSGNDAATAIAEHIGGSVEGFAYLMNEKARWLGMQQSVFANPTGLDEGGPHYASARDLAILTAHALKNPIFQEIVKTKHKQVDNPHEAWNYRWLNKNKMLFLFEGADGVKTGYTRLAKRCLVSSATYQGQQLAVVTLNDAQDWADHTKLLQYGFREFPSTSIKLDAELKLPSSVHAREVFTYPLRQVEVNQVVQRYIAQDEQSIAYRLGHLGQVQFSLDGHLIGSTCITVPRKSHH